MEDRVDEVIFVTSVGVTTPIGKCSIVLVDTVATSKKGVAVWLWAGWASKPPDLRPASLVLMLCEKIT